MGYGFVTMANASDANAVCEKLNKTELNGRTINIEIAEENRKNERRTKAPISNGVDAATVRKPRAPRAPRSTTTFTSVERTPREHQPREKREVTGEPSETCLFVGNLPWEFKKEQVLELFGKFSVKDVRIIHRYNGRSKGFGFVEFPNHQVQQEALKALDGFTCEGRQLSVRVAVGNATEKNEVAAV